MKRENEKEKNLYRFRQLLCRFSYRHVLNNTVPLQCDSEIT